LLRGHKNWWQECVTTQLHLSLYVSFYKQETSHVRFEALTAVKMSVLFFWFVMPCGLIGRYVSLKCRYLPKSPHGVTTQNNINKKRHSLWLLSFKELVFWITCNIKWKVTRYGLVNIQNEGNNFNVLHWHRKHLMINRYV
jgi:hypothetical protein